MADENDTPGGDQLLRDLVDFVLPVLPPYELSVYLLLLRRSHLETGDSQVCIGKRSIVAALGKMTRASSNMQHVTEKLSSLEALGFISVGTTDRLGTRYVVTLPRDVPSIREQIAMSGQVLSPPDDYYNHPELRHKLFERDGWRCRYCGELVDAETGTLDHMVPVSKGGENRADNLTTCCMMCNSIKAGRTYEEAAPQILARVAGRRASS